MSFLSRAADLRAWLERNLAPEPLYKSIGSVFLGFSQSSHTSYTLVATATRVVTMAASVFAFLIASRP